MVPELAVHQRGLVARTSRARAFRSMVGVPALDGRPTPLGRSGLRDEHRASLAPFRARGQRLGPGILESPRSTRGNLGPRADAPIAEASDGRGRPIRPAFRVEG